eukprot:118030_1
MGGCCASTSQSQYMQLLEDSEVIDNIDLFENEHCTDDTCTYLTRLITVLSKYNQVSLADSDKCIAFYDEHYSSQCLEDYIHFICVHNEDNYDKKLYTKNTKCSSANDCLWTQRHYRDRRGNNVNNHGVTDIYTDIFDTLHFYIYHMEECGLRVSLKNMVKYNTDDSAECIDEEFAAIQAQVNAKKQKYGMFKRLEGSKNSKFNLMNSVVKDENEEKKEKTFSDEMMDYICSVGVERNVAKNLKDYLAIEQYDTDAIEYDIDIYYDAKNCILLSTAGTNVKCIETIKDFIKKVHVSSCAFSTGFVFWYWKYYKNMTNDKIKQQQSCSADETNFGGYSMCELFVSSYFNSFKEEILNNKFISSITEFNDKVIQKGNAYMKTKKCKQIMCIVGSGHQRDETKDPLHFGIKYGEKLKKSHIYSLILYCDFTEFCTDFSSTFRKNKWNEPIQLVRERNRKYFHCSKNLREVIQYYGTDNYWGRNSKESGPFYSGISFVMNIPEFSIRLNGPTSTTRHKEVAIRFATRSGMIIQLNNKERPGSREVFFNVSWLSTYPEEAERIFCGGRYAIELQTIIIVETKANYLRFFRSFYKFDKMLCGAEDIDTLAFTDGDYNIINWFIQYISGTSTSDNDNKFAKFIRDTFYLFAKKK